MCINAILYSIKKKKKSKHISYWGLTYQVQLFIQYIPQLGSISGGKWAELGCDLCVMYFRDEHDSWWPSHPTSHTTVGKLSNTLTNDSWWLTHPPPHTTVGDPPTHTHPRQLVAIPPTLTHDSWWLSHPPTLLVESGVR